MTKPSFLSRRDFLPLATCMPLAAWATVARADEKSRFSPPLALFTKVSAQANLSLEQSAEVIAGAGLDGVDCPVRPKDEILPERVKEDLPRYADLLRQRGRKVLLLTTAILNVDSPHARDILTTAKQVGVTHYRLGFLRVPKGASVPKLVQETRGNLKALAALNEELGLCAMIQNHSATGSEGYLGGDLNVMAELVQGFDPKRIGVAFDLGHALLVHGDDWPKHFARLKTHLAVAYVKDTHRQRRFVPFGEGEFGQTDLFRRLKEMNYRAPLSIHIEYNWDDGGKDHTQAALLKAAGDCTKAVRGWLAKA